MPPEPFIFICPRCRTRLETCSPEEQYCPKDGLRFPKTGGIWRFLLPEDHTTYQQFIEEYEIIRKAEGRGAPHAAYYRALPYQDLNGTMKRDWRIRAASFDAFLVKILQPLENARRRSLGILDLGAGNGWLANRLAQRGHQVAAVDLASNDFDGLGAHRFYQTRFTPVQADFNRLPLAEGQADLVIYNAAFHYAQSYERTLAETLRVLCPEGQIVILDTPVYREKQSGAQMVREREADFIRRYGFPSNALTSENYLTYARLKALSSQSGLIWQIHRPDYGWRWALRPLLHRLRGRREPAAFLLLAGQRSAA